MAKKPKAKKRKRPVLGKDFDGWAYKDCHGQFYPHAQQTRRVNEYACGDWVRVKFVEVPS